MIPQDRRMTTGGTSSPFTSREPDHLDRPTAMGENSSDGPKTDRLLSSDRWAKAVVALEWRPGSYRPHIGHSRFGSGMTAPSPKADIPRCRAGF